MSVMRLDGSAGNLELLTVADGVMNPAFLRWHPHLNVLYGCTESVKENGLVYAWSIHPDTGKLTEIGKADAGGTSTCYLFLDHDVSRMLLVNYWDATIGVLPLNSDGSFASKSITFRYDPKENPGKMHVSADKHVNHSINDLSAQKERQLDPHSHAVVLEPHFGVVAYVPDLGRDLVRELYYDKATGELRPLSVFPSGPKHMGPHGPRYIEFHRRLPVAYVINELSSYVAVFAVDEAELNKIVKEGGSNGETKPTLTYVQSISTIPDAWPRANNTCGRICSDPSGRFVLVSNRGHDSIAVFRVEQHCRMPGLLSSVGVFHTRGMTPRHFQFDPSGQWLIAANQDTDRVGVFQFNVQCGTLNWTGNYHSIHSPNFILGIEPRQYIECTGVVDDIEALVQSGSPARRGIKRQPDSDNKYNKKQFA
jgi:6-phosphogluconolactonase (cycloisomerase 2 family)